MSKIMRLSGPEIAQMVKNNDLNLCVIGLGRIGLPTSLLFADAGLNVAGVDINTTVVKEANQGRTNIDEPELEDLMKKAIRTGRFKATTNLPAATEGSDIIMLCLPTPLDDSKSPDYTAITSTSQSLSTLIPPDSLLIIESTVGPGTVENLIIPNIEANSKKKTGRDFGVASCPERANPSAVVQGIRTTPRIVGGIDEKSGEIASALYRVALGVDVIRVSNPRTANAVKLTENISRDVNIALMNELAVLYEKLNIDIIEVIKAASSKWNFQPHYPGPGVGGPCLPANPHYLIVEGQKAGYIPHMVRLAREINDRMPDNVVQLTMQALNEAGKTVKNSRILVLGVTYKPDVRDTQNSPIIRVIRRLLDLGAHVECYDPMYEDTKIPALNLPSVWPNDPSDFDCIIYGVAHKALHGKLQTIIDNASTKAAIVDATGKINPEPILSRSITFRGVGRSNRPRISK